MSDEKAIAALSVVLKVNNNDLLDRERERLGLRAGQIAVAKAYHDVMQGSFWPIKNEERGYPLIEDDAYANLHTVVVGGSLTEDETARYYDTHSLTELPLDRLIDGTSFKKWAVLIRFFAGVMVDIPEPPTTTDVPVDEKKA